MPWLRILFTTLTMTLLLTSQPQRAFAAKDWPEFTALSPALRTCLEKRLAPGLLEALTLGEIPDSRKDRKTAKAAFMACQAQTGAGPDGAALYDGPLFDAMCQIDETFDMERAMALVRQAGVDKLALFARSRKTLHQNEQALLTLAKRHPALVVLGAPKYFQLSDDLSESFIEATLSGIRDHGYRFIGEILYTHGDKKSGAKYSSGERYVDPSRPGTSRLLQGLRGLGVPVMVHIEAYAPERDFPRFHELFQAWPEQIFIVPHMAFASPEQVTQFLERHPNVFMTMSKKATEMNDWADPAKQAARGSPFLDGITLRPEWRAVLIRFADQLLAATDAHMARLWEIYPTGVDYQRLVLGQLPRKVAEQIGYKNAEQLYGVKAR